MAAHIGQPTRTRRFIKLYLFTWALLASGALAYLAMLTFPPHAEVPAPQASVGPVRGTTTETKESKALGEVRSMQSSLSEVRKDVSQLQEAVGERVINEKVVQTRLNALEERVSTIDRPNHAPATAPGIQVPDRTSQHTGQPRTVAEPPLRPIDESSAAAVAPAPGAPIETGSIAPKIVFGEPVVTRAGPPEMAVQLAAGPSLQAVRQSWELLSERHSGTLAALQPRVIAPRGEGGVYRLVAGPLPTKADAERICSQLSVGSKACFATLYAGAPL